MLNPTQTVKTNGDGVNQFLALVLRDFHPASHRDFADYIAILSFIFH